MVKGELSSNEEAFLLELNNNKFKDNINMLRSYLFISIKGNKISFKMHRLIQFTTLK